MTTTKQRSQHSPIEVLYLWGSRYVGGVLLVGIVFHVSRLLTGSSDGIITDLARVWPDLALISLAMVPVVALAVAGMAWVLRDRRDMTGWMAIATALFLTSLWALK